MPVIFGIIGAVLLGYSAHDVWAILWVTSLAVVIGFGLGMCGWFILFGD